MGGNMEKIILLFIFCITLSNFAYAAEPIAVVVHKSNSIDNISRSDLAKIYKGHTEYWNDGQKILVLNHKLEAHVRRIFYKKVMNTEASKKFFKPGSPIPFEAVEKKSNRSINYFVKRIANAIGYMDLSAVSDSVKVIKINGVSHTEDSYILK